MSTDDPAGSILGTDESPVIVPRRGEVSFGIPGGGMVARNKAGVLQLGSFASIFAFEPAGTPLFLRAVMKILPAEEPDQRNWSENRVSRCTYPAWACLQ